MTSLTCPSATPLPSEYHLCYRCRTLYHESALLREGRERWACARHRTIREARSGEVPAVQCQVEAVLLREKLRWVAELPLGRYWVDYYVPALHLAIEVKGLAYHGQSRAAKDARREAFIRSRGYALATMSGRDIWGSLSAAIAVRRTQMRKEREAEADYPRRLAELREQIVADPYLALPKPKDFSMRGSDHRDLEAWRVSLVREADAQYRAALAAKRSHLPRSSLL